MWMIAQAIMLVVIITVPLKPDTVAGIMFAVPAGGFLVCAMISILVEKRNA